MPLPQMHGRTHIPAGYAAVVQPSDGTDHLAQSTSDQIPSVLGSSSGSKPWMAIENLGQTLSSGSFQSSLLTDAWWDPVLVTGDPIASGANNNTYFTLTSHTTYWELTTRLEGWYTLELVHLWSNITSLTTSPAYAAQQINFDTTGIHFFHDRQPGAATDWANVVTEINGYAYIHTYRTIYLPAAKAWPVNVKQTTGDARDCSGHLKVWYEDHFGSTTTDNADWTFDSV